jgi:hypothetical protein
MTDASTSYTLSIINNLPDLRGYANYYNEMKLAEVDNQLESDSIGLLTGEQSAARSNGPTGLYGTYTGIFTANREMHVGVASIVASLSTLSPTMLGAGEGAQLVGFVMGVTQAAMGINSALRAAVEAQALWETAQAFIEAAAAAFDPLMWPALAVAFATAAFVAYEFGEANWDIGLPHAPNLTVAADISTGQGQRTVHSTLMEQRWLHREG